MLSQGALVENLCTGLVYRLLKVVHGTKGPVAQLFEMDGAKALPKAVPLAELKSSDYKVLQSRATPIVVRSAPAKKEEDEKAEKSPSETLGAWRMSLIEPLVVDDRIYTRRLRGPLVAERAKDTKASEQTIMACLRMYWRGGMTADALLGNYRFSGVKKTHANETTPARGRKPRNGRYAIFSWTDEFKAKALRTIRQELKKNRLASDKVLYRRVISKHFCVTTIEERDGQQKVKVRQKPLGERPSRAQLYYLIHAHRGLEEKLRDKLGDDNFENNVDPKTGSTRLEADFAGHIFEIDATIPDVWICDEDDPNTVLGKATLYLVIDVYTRLIVGFHLTLDSCSWASAMEAYMTLVEDKRTLCERWGFDYQEEDWPAHGCVSTFVRADRGPEFTSYASDTIADNLAVHVINTPKRKAPRKGTVECSVKLVQVPIKENVGGYTPPEEFGKRQVSDRKGQATRTLKSVACEILGGMRLNNRKVHRRMDLPAAHVFNHVQAIPVDLWRLSTEESGGLQSRYEENYLRFKLLPSDDKFSVTHRGVYYKGLLWEPDQKQRKQWFLRAATSGFYKVSATFDRRSVAVIYVHDKKDPTKWTTMHLVANMAHHQGRSWPEYEALKEVKLTLDELAEEHNLTLELQNDYESGEREDASRRSVKQAGKAAGGRSRTADSVPKRAKAVQVERMAIPVLASTAPPLSPSGTQGSPSAVLLPASSDSSAPIGAIDQPKLAATTANKAFMALLNLKAKK